MTRFLTEDKSDSPFVKLFNAAYPKAVLECTGRNSKLPYRARKLAESGDQVVVYLDMVPDNGALKVIYDKLFALHDDDLDVVVIPIVCAEYAFICSVANLSGPIYDRSGLSDVIGKSSVTGVQHLQISISVRYLAKVLRRKRSEEKSGLEILKSSASYFVRSV